MSHPTDGEIETFIRERFETNLRRIQAETGAGLAPHIKQMALRQVIYYWRRLNKIATQVTETEVRLNLPSLRTPQGREYGIEGVVDIVREDGRTIMYDIKSNDADYVHAHRAEYSSQLNVYAHIWQVLREQELSETAVISTSLPTPMKVAIANEDWEAVEREMDRWEPVVSVPFDPSDVDQAIGAFGEVVDQIEDGLFSPPDVERLISRGIDDERPFASHVCRNCDARFSCGSYRIYANGSAEKEDPEFAALIESMAEEWEQEERYASLLEEIPEPEQYKDLVR